LGIAGTTRRDEITEVIRRKKGTHSMATFSIIAEALAPDSLTWQGYAAGIRKNPPGVPLRDILKHNEGAYETEIELTDRFRAKVRAVAELTGDHELMKIAGLSEVTISLEHFRGADPDIRISVGYSLQCTPEENEQLSLDRKEQERLDPRNTLAGVTFDPDSPSRVRRI
jgi:hypothetical protein